MIKIVDDKVLFFHGPLSNFWRSPFKAEIEEYIPDENDRGTKWINRYFLIT